MAASRRRRMPIGSRRRWSDGRGMVILGWTILGALWLALVVAAAMVVT